MGEGAIVGDGSDAEGEGAGGREGSVVEGEAAFVKGEGAGGGEEPYNFSPISSVLRAANFLSFNRIENFVIFRAEFAGFKVKVLWSRN